MRKHRGSRTLLKTAIVLTIAALAGVWLIGSILTRSTNTIVPRPAVPGRVVSIKSDPGIILAATYWAAPVGPAAPAVLLLHGNGSNRTSMTDVATLLNRKGCAVLAIDFRGHGQSTAAPKSFGLFEAADARAAAHWLRERQPGKLGIIGYSLGGAAALLGEVGPVPADALVLEGVYPDIHRAIFDRVASRLGSWPATLIEPFLSFQSMPRFGVWPSRISPLRALENVSEPVFIVGGGSDTNTTPAETREMYHAVRRKGGLLILPGVTHEQLGHALPIRQQQILLRFLNQSLGSCNGSGV